jgi:hypothetical protein
MYDGQWELLTREYIGRSVKVNIEFRAVPTLPHISTRPEASPLFIVSALNCQRLCALQDTEQ